MKKKLFMAVAAIAALSSCSNENDSVAIQTENEVLTFTASMESVGADSRATFDNTNKCASWEKYDDINVNGKTYRAQSSGTTTTFVPLNNMNETSAPYTAFFPTDIMSYDRLHLLNVNAETWREGQFNMPMYASSTTTNLQFKNLCGVLKIIVKNDQIESVRRIRVSSENCAMSGDFTVENDAAKLKNPTDASKNAEILYTATVATDAAGKAFYVPIPPQTYRKLKIELDPDSKGYTKSMTTKSSTDIVIARNKIYTINFADNTPPTTGTAKATINGEEVDVKWVQLWADGPKFAEFNVGVTDGKAESYGGYYCWGSSIDQDMTSDPYRNTGSAVLTGDDDTATKLWGPNWRMPTEAELWKLANHTSGSSCVNASVTVNGVKGKRFTGRFDYFRENSIFLPFAGQLYYGSSIQLQFKNSSGYYWTSTPSSTNASFINISSSGPYGDNRSRKNGYSVRAVLVE